MHYSGSMQQAFYRLLDYGVRNDYLSFTGTYNRIRSKYYLWGMIAGTSFSVLMCF